MCVCVWVGGGRRQQRRVHMSLTCTSDVGTCSKLTSCLTLRSVSFLIRGRTLRVLASFFFSPSLSFFFFLSKFLSWAKALLLEVPVRPGFSILYERSETGQGSGCGEGREDRLADRDGDRQRQRQREDRRTYRHNRQTDMMVIFYYARIRYEHNCFLLRVRI